MARSSYQYETSPRKLQPSYRTEKSGNLRILETQQQNKSVASGDRKTKIKVTLYIVAVFAVLLVISYRNSQINEQFNKVQSLKKELSILQKENEQLKVGIENSLNNNYIEQQAKEKLGMKKLTNKQTVYVALPKKDYVESPSERVVIEDDEDKGVIDNILSALNQ